MGYYKVNFDSLDTVYQNISGQAASWSEKMETLSGKITSLLESDNMSGATADAIRSYLNSVHGTIIGVLGQLISLHTTNLLIYKTEYQSDIDTELHAIIDTAEVDDIQDFLAKKKSQAISVDENVAYALGQISDIFSIGYQDVTSVSEAHTNTVAFLQDLCDSIEQLEQNHVASDFSCTQELISSLTAFINERLNNKRDFSSFTEAELSSSASFLGLYNAYLAATDELQGKSEVIERAYDIENTRMESLQEEYEERERKAQTFKWIVTAACVVGSVVAIAATGGAATPLVVGAISACSGALIAGASSGADQYVEHGWNASQWDWGTIGKDTLVGGATGFVTGYLGAGIGQVANTALNTANSVGAGAVIGSVSQIGSGVVTRAAGVIVEDATTSLIEGKEFNLDETLDDAKDAAFDPKQIVLDGVIGGVSGGISTAKNLKAEQSVITDGSQIDENGDLKADVTYKTGEHDYIYSTDENGYIVEAHADNLQLKTHEGRLANATDTYGKQSGDQAGHLIGDRFGGSPEIDNLTSQNGRLNQSDYKMLENQWAEAIENGQKVSVDIQVNYPKVNSGRPSSYDVTYQIDGEEFFQRFLNK